MDHSQHTPIARHEMTKAVVTGAPIYGADDRQIGKVAHVHGDGPVTEVVVEVGGFLGIGSKEVLVSIDQLNLMRDGTGSVHGVTAWTKEQLNALPPLR